MARAAVGSEARLVPNQGSASGEEASRGVITSMVRPPRQRPTGAFAATGEAPGCARMGLATVEPVSSFMPMQPASRTKAEIAAEIGNKRMKQVQFDRNAGGAAARRRRDR